MIGGVPAAEVTPHQRQAPEVELESRAALCDQYRLPGGRYFDFQPAGASPEHSGLARW
jgi:hypothetical protein